jgi:hypothetical protein
MKYNEFMGSEDLDEIIENIIEDNDPDLVLPAWLSFKTDVEGYCPDWPHGDHLIAEHYFDEYIRETVEDCYEIPHTWPYSCIDWEQVAREAQHDYTELTDPNGNGWLMQ